MRWLALLGLLVALLAGAALLLLPPDDGAGERGGDDGGRRPLVASLTAQPHACSLCHYAWDVPLRFEGDVERVEGGWRYRMAFAPSAAYNLTDVRVVPVVRGDEAVSSVRLPSSGTVARGQEAVVPIHLSRNASGVHVLLDTSREFGRSVLTLTLEGPPGALPAQAGAAGVRGASWAPEGGLPAGMYRARIRYADGAPVQEAWRLEADVASTDARIVPHATGEAPARFEFVLPERPRGFAVQLRPMNEHPTEKWMLPNWGDRGEVALFVAEGEPAPARTWSAERVEEMWDGQREIVLHDSRQDGVIVRSQDARGEWTRQARWITPPPAEEPFPPLLPGTIEVLAEITWAPRTPLSPVVPPYFSWAHHLGPTFYYPEPVVDDPGRRVYRVQVDPAWWQEPRETGGFQGFALLPLDERRTTVFDGSYGIRLTIVR